MIRHGKLMGLGGFKRVETDRRSNMGGANMGRIMNGLK